MARNFDEAITVLRDKRRDIRAGFRVELINLDDLKKRRAPLIEQAETQGRVEATRMEIHGLTSAIVTLLEAAK